MRDSGLGTRDSARGGESRVPSPESRKGVPMSKANGKRATAGDVVVDRLIDWGVSVVFGIPGDGINGVMEALRTRQGRIRFVQVRHEESAAFMACAYAKFTGRLGVCLATS